VAWMGGAALAAALENALNFMSMGRGKPAPTVYPEYFVKVHNRPLQLFPALINMMLRYEYAGN